jgi:arabinan endo-1,5-alpha-L-arabinosidase
MKATEHTSLARLLGLGSMLLLLCVLLMAGVGGAQETTYTNPVSKTFADTFADPSIIKAKDGYWYAYGTSDPLKEGETTPHTIPMARSKDLVHWRYVGDAFTSAAEVSWADTTPCGDNKDVASLWAPDIRYIDGRYYMYYVVTQTKVTSGCNDNAIGVATAPTPTGPWKDSGAPVVGPREGNGGFLWTFDPSEFTRKDGTHFLYYGSYNGGVYVTKLSPDGTRRVGKQTMVAIDNRYEGAYVVRHGSFYYLFGSSANCCAGPTTGYSVYVGRSRSLRGPFVDKQGQSMTESRVGGSIVVTPNGNKWVGTGHNAVVTDLSGQDYLVYHAINRHDPYLNEPFGTNERPMLLDRLDWVNGWPTVRDGRWASAGPQPAPVTDGPVNDSFNRTTSLGDGWNRIGGAWHLLKEADGQGYAIQQGASDRRGLLIARSSLPANVRAEADLRLAGGRAAGVVVRYKNENNYAVAWLDRRANDLVTDAVVGGRSVGQKSASLPTDFPFGKWHNVAVQVRGSKMTAEVTDARLNDPYAVVRRTLPDALSDGKAGLASRGGRIEADNFSAVKLYVPHTDLADPPDVGTVLPSYSDGFNDGTLGPAWSWRRDPDGSENDGSYNWPVQEADIVGQGDANNASILLRAAPKGAYTVQTKLTINLGVDAIHNYQQGGLIAYINDDHWVRLSHVAIWDTRQTEFGKEMPYAGATSFGGMLVGPPARTTWLRLSHRMDPKNGEHEFRAATSRDGKHWIWGGTWTLPPGKKPQIGLISLGKDPNDSFQATAKFDYFRVYRP